ncbi:ABC transporter ATP-binding protein [Bifidobacterium callimiconis]|uniref:MacB family efflux pump subunit n=1 Tax=Bifidobacterium callimiconis TaxID=2306973 RepID=A0A430FHE0_9BIFI|nr:ABC transporter ATP-binding protein [Bifidobacterium callimiconis]MBT1177937.1 ABC transporter ATP-binding protein [Bifidobacterium callimiconis]RSX52325.1 MacB family efflux pump subunit [Bifidobacterium callimiconis]
MPIEMIDVRFRYSPLGPAVLDGVTLTIPDGQMIALVGPSGSGKTTLLQIIGGILKPSEGVVRCDTSIGRMRWIFQTPMLLARQTVRQNIDIAISTAPWNARTREARVQEMLADVGLDGYADHRVNTLSGGQQQRVQIARALACRPPVVLADEPTGQLDHATTTLVMNAIAKARGHGTTMVIVTHDEYVASYCERVVRLEDGRIHSVKGGDAHRMDDCDMVAEASDE